LREYEAGSRDQQVTKEFGSHNARFCVSRPAAFNPGALILFLLLSKLSGLNSAAGKRSWFYYFADLPREGARDFYQQLLSSNHCKALSPIVCKFVSAIHDHFA
jgi:hypothetical protein